MKIPPNPPKAFRAFQAALTVLSAPRRHHASIVPLFGYYLSEGMGGGFIAALPLWNSLVHVVMYSHYLLTSLVVRARPPPSVLALSAPLGCRHR